MFKKLKRSKQKKDNTCARTGCNNQVRRERNGTEFNYCSQNCQRESHYYPGSSELYDGEEVPPYTSTSSSSNQWEVWTSNRDDAPPPSYSSVNNDYEIFGNIDDVQVTPLWEDDVPSSNTQNSSRPRPEDDFPTWFGATSDPLWTPSSPPVTPPRSNSPSNEGEINCPKCTFFIRPNKTVCEMCGHSITRPEPKKSLKKPKDTITSFYDLYEDEDLNPFADPPSSQSNNERNNRGSTSNYGGSSSTESRNRSSSDNYRDSGSRNQSSYSSYLDYDEDLSYSESRNQRNRATNSDDHEGSSYSRSRNRNLDDFEDSSHSRSRNRNLDDFEDSSHSRSRNRDLDNFEDSSYSRSRNRNLDDFEDSSHSRSRNRNLDDFEDSSHSRSRNRNLDDFEDSSHSRSRSRNYTSQLWIDDDETHFESTPTRRPQRQRPPPKPYSTPSFFSDADRHSGQSVQRPPTPPDEKLTCTACNFDNHLTMTHCELCYTQLDKKPEPNNRDTIFNRTERRTKKACGACSLLNNSDNAQCEMCFTPFEEPVRPGLPLHDPDKVLCPSCTFMNHSSMAQCEVCNAALPGGNLLQKQLEYEQYRETLKNLPGLTTKFRQLQATDQDYVTVQQHLRAGIPNANVLAIFRLIMPDRLVQAHEAYKRQIAGNKPLASVTHRMYHGTRVVCDAKRYYGPPGWTYCAAPGCGLCGITQNGNTCATSKHNGVMWFANSSAISLGYCRTDPIKAMFIEDIISATGGQIITVNNEAATLAKFLIIFR